MARASRLHREGWGFESLAAHKKERSEFLAASEQTALLAQGLLTESLAAHSYLLQVDYQI